MANWVLTASMQNRLLLGLMFLWTNHPFPADRSWLAWSLRAYRTS